MGAGGQKSFGSGRALGLRKFCGILIGMGAAQIVQKFDRYYLLAGRRAFSLSTRSFAFPIAEEKFPLVGGSDAHSK